ncbi:hypothetical protein GCM10009753_03920 [Streptantibioticus ferralitis]|uniref:Uncharacterized protein n=1 Tax=Streptantibioticus ferralitis TaxID=236510 RepID=A0ABT5Z112_9ACTN|nr:hypothetical protein [Streptantibioticus ferralitis]MDF2257528.1 hypothetical protein [Streptantibioticus ferralitis]
MDTAPFSAEAFRRALDDACHIAGVSAEGADLVHVTVNAVFRLTSVPLVVRIAGPQLGIEDAVRIVGLARWLENEDLPTVRLAVLRVDQPVITASGMPATFWRYLPQRPELQPTPTPRNWPTHSAASTHSAHRPVRCPDGTHSVSPAPGSSGHRTTPLRQPSHSFATSPTAWQTNCPAFPSPCPVRSSTVTPTSATCCARPAATPSCATWTSCPSGHPSGTRPLTRLGTCVDPDHPRGRGKQTMLENRCGS